MRAAGEQALDARARALAERRERLRAFAESSRPSRAMIHFAGAGFISANAASTSGCSS